MTSENIFGGKRILLVEDDYFIVMQMIQDLEQSGAQVIGPIPSVEKALDRLENLASIDAAILDINLQGNPVFPVAEELSRQGIPFVFASGYDETVIPQRFAEVPLLEKTLDVSKIATILLGYNRHLGWPSAGRRRTRSRNHT
jgi:CheY-like chemotaxis protein